MTQPTSTTDDSLRSRTDKVGKVVSQPDSSSHDLSQHDILNRLNQDEETSSQIDSRTDKVPTGEKTLVEQPSGPSGSNPLVSTTEQGSEKVVRPGEAERPRDDVETSVPEERNSNPVKVPLSVQKRSSTHITRKIANITIRGRRPNITTCRSKYSCLTTRSKLWPKMPTITYPSQPVPRRPKLPPGNPTILVDVYEEPTFLFVDVLL